MLNQKITIRWILALLLSFSLYLAIRTNSTTKLDNILLIRYCSFNYVHKLKFQGYRKWESDLSNQIQGYVLNHTQCYVEYYLSTQSHISWDDLQALPNDSCSAPAKSSSRLHSFASFVMTLDVIIYVPYPRRRRRYLSRTEVYWKMTYHLMGLTRDSAQRGWFVNILSTSNSDFAFFLHYFSCFCSFPPVSLGLTHFDMVFVQTLMH